MRAFAFVLQPAPLAHAEAVLLVDDGEGQPGEEDVVLEEGMGADRDLGLARRQRPQLLGPAGTLIAACEQHHPDVLGLEWLGDGLVVLARQDLCRGHQRRLQAGVRRVRHGQHGHHGLAGAHVALEQPAHPLAGLKVAADLGQGHGLAAGQTEGQGGFEPARGLARGNGGGGLAPPRALALGHGQLVGEELVIGQAPPLGRVQQGVGLGLWRMQGLQRRAPAHKPFARHEGRVLPFGELGRAVQRLVSQLAHRARSETRGGRIDGLEGRDLVRPFGRQHIVRMVDLELDAELPTLDLAADGAQGAFGVLALQAVAEHLEIDQEEEAGLVRHPDPVGRAPTARRQVGVHAHQEDLGLALARLVRLGVAALHHPGRRQ